MVHRIARCLAQRLPLTMVLANQMARMTTETLDEQARIAFEDIVIAAKGAKCYLFLGAAMNAPPAGDFRYQYTDGLRPPNGNSLAENAIESVQRHYSISIRRHT